MMISKKICKICLKPLPTDKHGNLLNTGNICHECLRKQKNINKIDWNRKKEEFENIIQQLLMELFEKIILKQNHLFEDIQLIEFA